jgi:hypothetical protein
MTSDQNRKSGAAAAREQRLAAKLRENLTRRKTQARARRGGQEIDKGVDRALDNELPGTDLKET